MVYRFLCPLCLQSLGHSLKSTLWCGLVLLWLRYKQPLWPSRRSGASLSSSLLLVAFEVGSVALADPVRHPVVDRFG